MIRAMQCSELLTAAVFISGHSYSAAGTGNKTSPNYGDCDIWVIRLNARGEEVWQRSYGGTGADTGWNGDVIKPTLDGGFLILISDDKPIYYLPIEGRHHQFEY